MASDSIVLSLFFIIGSLVKINSKVLMAWHFSVLEVDIQDPCTLI